MALTLSGSGEMPLGSIRCPRNSKEDTPKQHLLGLIT